MNANWISYLPKIIRAKLENRYDLQATFSNVGWLFFDKVIRLSGGLLIGAWVARYLGPDDFGSLAYVVAIISIFQVITPLGMDNVAIRDIAAKPQSSADILGSIFILRLISSFLCYFVAIFVIYLLKPHDERMLHFGSIAAGCIFFQFSDVVDLWFQSQLQSKRTILAKSTAYLISILIKSILIVTQQPLIYFAAMICFESILTAFALRFAYNRYPTNKVWQFRWEMCIRLLIDGAPFLISAILLTLYMQMDRLLLASIVGNFELSYYAVASTVASVFYFIPMIFFSSFAPGIAKIKDLEDKRVLFIKLTSVILWSGAFAGVFVFLSSQYVIGLLYGSTYAKSAPILNVMAFSIIPIFLSVANDYYALSVGRGRVTLIRTACGLSINLILNYTLIPEMGAMGAAIAGLAAHIVSNTVVYWAVMPGSIGIFRGAVLLPFYFVFNTNLDKE